MIEINNIIDVEKYIAGMEAVIFDLDDTLYPEKEYVRCGFEAIAKKYPHIEKMADKLWEAFKDGKPAIDYVLEGEGLIYEKANCLEVYRHQIPAIHFYQGVEEMIKRVKKNSKIGVITDGRPEGQRSKIDALRLNALADKIIVTDELGGIAFRKPNQLAFQIMKDFFNTAYEKMVYVGDNIQKDGIAPEKLGMKFIHFNNLDGLYQ